MMRMRIAICVAIATAAGGVGLAGIHPARANEDRSPDIVTLQHTQDVLRRTYVKGRPVVLPRLLFFDAAGRVLLVENGLRGGIGYRLRRALKRDEPMSIPLTLDNVLGEVVDGSGKPVVLGDLPVGDGYVAEYWAEWCAPCHEMARDVERQIRRWQRDGMHVVWLKIESDPQKLPERAGS